MRNEIENNKQLVFVSEYFIDGNYSDSLSMVTNDNSIKFKLLKDEIERLLLNSGNILTFVESVTSLGGYSALPLQIKNLEERESILIAFYEKLYFDLFSDKEDFKFELLRFIDPDTGLLRQY